MFFVNQKTGYQLKIYFAADGYTFHQDSVPCTRDRWAASSRDAGLHRTWLVASPLNNADLNHVDYRLWEVLQERVYQH